MKLPEGPLLVFVTPAGAPAETVQRAAEGACRGGTDIVQLRRQGDEAGALLELARALRAVTRRHGRLLLVNDRLDVALAAEADGAHLPAAGIAPGSARRLLGPEALLGCSVHSAREILDLPTEAAVDLVQFGTVFPTPSKPAGPTQGTEGLVPAAAAARVRAVKLVAVGGIDASNAARTVEAGADGVAVIRALAEAGDPEAAARHLVEELARGARLRREPPRS